MFSLRPLHLLILIFIAYICLTSTFAFGATAILPDEEVEALKIISRTLGETNWTFNPNPCNNVTVKWEKEEDNVTNINEVACNCSSTDNTSCHVVSIRVKGKSLAGTLPKEFVRLPFLQEIDLTYNYLNGTIPLDWGSMQNIRFISLYGNRLTGSIPKELGNISNLETLVLEINQLSGSLPPELANLHKIKRLHLNSNKFIGEIPKTFAKLTTLTHFSINDNNFTGKIPDFIQNWINLERLAIQASGLIGPISSSITTLKNLTDLRISDLNGPDATIPPLGNMKQMKILILRSCNLKGELPNYFENMTNLKYLDLSFNKLSGGIPATLSHLDLNYLYLTGNKFNGTIPDFNGDHVNWQNSNNWYRDLSYNNFKAGSQMTSSCQQSNMNLFASTSPSNISGNVFCLRGSPCLNYRYSLRINCGGRGVSTYEDDEEDKVGPSIFFQSKSTWAFSSTGDFLAKKNETGNYIGTNTSKLLMKDSHLYMNARFSPNSLTYYGFCLGNGKYSVNLHFAEIIFTNDNTYKSLGRRIFDIYIQGELVKKDFNIEDEVGGVGKAIIKKFHAVVKNNTLEIRLQWAGKGTTAIPEMGVYGPLISAISVNSKNRPPLEKRMVVFIVAGVTSAIIIIIMGILWWKRCYRRKSTLGKDLRGLELQTSSFTLRQIKAATNNFDPANKIGEGGFGPVYKGILANGKVIAVKQLSTKSRQGNHEFVTEIGMVSALQHPHLVKLYGCCIEGNQLLLIYEYLENNNLARALFGPEELQLKLDWPTRQRICIGIARGLAYLHEESRLKIVHRDIKATNVLLDKNLNPKISDFGLAKLDEEENTHISTRIAGTYGYMSPEYAMHGHLTNKADVYSFGIVALEIVSGRCNIKKLSNGQYFNLLNWAHVLKEEGCLMDLVDPKIGHDYNVEEVMIMIDVALICTNPTATARPSMSLVVSMLEGRASVQEFFMNSTVSASHERHEEAVKNLYQKLEKNDENDADTKSMLRESPQTSSSTAAVDL